jgi:2-polyprenyl-3-methyl-5-hydroxy-6-metoxy-1,4-benzoquinol methylase
MTETRVRTCWCGNDDLQPYSEWYRVCRACGTLVSQAEFSSRIYAKDYWTERQKDHLGLPDIRERARLDLPERCTYWLRHLLSLRKPPARVLEVGCAHGAYVALLGWAGFEVTGTELSPEVVKLAKDMFKINVLAGLIEDQPFAAGSFDIIVLNDVLEHLPRPLATLSHCSRLLTENGIFILQTPEYKEHLSYEDLKASGDLFLRHMQRMETEHLYLFSRRSVTELFKRLGIEYVEFANPVYAYDLYFTASRVPSKPVSEPEITDSLSRTPQGRLVQALLDKAFESNDRWWAIKRLEEANGRGGPAGAP